MPFTGSPSNYLQFYFVINELSHTSVFNGGPLESHFGSPGIQKHVYMFLDLRRAKVAVQGAAIKYGRMAPSLEPFWLL